MASDRDPEQTRARILNAAMEDFARRGFEAATLRDIASQAGVSLGLIRHHFGSKQQLREACTDFALNAVRGAEAQAARRGPDVVPISVGLQQYMARTVLEDSPGGRALFDEMFAASSRLNRANNTPEDSALPLVLTVMTLGIPLLEAQLTRILGTPALEGDGLKTVQRALVELFTTTQMDIRFITADGAGGVGAPVTG